MRHDNVTDPICAENCLDVCVDYNSVANKHVLSILMEENQ